MLHQLQWDYKLGPTEKGGESEREREESCHHAQIKIVIIIIINKVDQNDGQGLTLVMTELSFNTRAIALAPLECMLFPPCIIHCHLTQCRPPKDKERPRHK